MIFYLNANLFMYKINTLFIKLTHHSLFGFLRLMEENRKVRIFFSKIRKRPNKNEPKSTSPTSSVVRKSDFRYLVAAFDPWSGLQHWYSPSIGFLST